MRVTRSAAVMAAVVVGLGLTMALVQPAVAQPDCDVPKPPPICGRDDPPPPKPQPKPPTLSLDGAQQTTSRSAVRVWGWTADADAPNTPLTVKVSIDAVSAGAVTASQSRPDVGAAYPQYGAAHGFDLVLPASAAGHNICVTAVNVGTGADQTVCRLMDDIVEFEAYSISYDTAHAVLTGTTLEELDKVKNINNTAIQQSTEISGSKTSTNIEGWSDTVGVKVTVSAGFKAGIPILADGKVTVTVEGSYSFARNSSTQRSQTFSWRQPVLVPARSIVEAAVAVTHATIVVPYALSGDFIYRSGGRAGGNVGGMFAGGNSDYLTVELKQYNVDGTTANAPVKQPRAALLKVSREQ